MKKYFIIATAMMCMAQVSNATNDTVTVIDEPHQVIITETPTGTKVKVLGNKDDEQYNYTYSVQNTANDTIHATSDWEINYPFKKSGKRHHWCVESRGLYFGGGLSTSNELVNNSYNWGFLQIVGLEYNTLHGQHFSLGVGYDVKRFSLKRPNCFVQDENTKVITTDLYPNEVTKRSSILHVEAIQFPVLFQQDLKNDFRIVLGATMNWNMYAKCNTHYKVNSTDYDITYHNIKQNKLTLDFIGSIGWNVLSLYCRYSPNEMFKKGFGPEIKNTWTLGVAICL